MTSGNKPKRPYPETLRYKNMVANLKGRQPHVKEAALIKELAGGKVWRIEAAIEALSTHGKNAWSDWNYVSTTDIMKQAAMFGRLQAVQAICKLMQWEGREAGFAGEQILTGFNVAVMHGHYKVADYLHANGARPDYMVKGMRGAVASAVAEGDVRKVDYLIAKGASPSSMLRLAVYEPGMKKHLVLHLLKKGADINQETEGSTALDLAVKVRRYDLADLFLARGGQAQSADTVYKLMDDAALPVEKKRALFSRLLAAGAPLSPQCLEGAVYDGRLEEAQMLLDAGLSISGRHNDQLPLRVAIARGGQAGIDFCLRSGANVARALEIERNESAKPPYSRLSKHAEILSWLENACSTVVQKKPAGPGLG